MSTQLADLFDDLRPTCTPELFRRCIHQAQEHLAPNRLCHRQGSGTNNCTCRAEQQDESSRLLEEDMARYNPKRNGQNSEPTPYNQESNQRITSGAKDLLDKVLIADFFFVCLALVWLGLGVVEKSTLQSSKLLTIWYPLWTLLFQPAIGVLMLGALVSGGVGWLEKRGKDD